MSHLSLDVVALGVAVVELLQPRDEEEIVGVLLGVHRDRPRLGLEVQDAVQLVLPQLPQTTRLRLGHVRGDLVGIRSYLLHLDLKTHLIFI